MVIYSKKTWGGKKQDLDINSLYILKAISCMIVILLHCPFSGFWGRFIAYFMRFPVPIFFVISGYFCKDKMENYKRKWRFKVA